jgi:Fur family ferric uptake transcriptional regulator
MQRQVEAWERHLRSHGFRITAQRELILRSVQELPHPNQDSILDYVRNSAQDLNRTTVYRTLGVLEDVGLIQHSHVGSGAPVYHLTAQAAHIHLVCQSCGEVISVPGETATGFAELLYSQTGFQVDVSHTALWGLCEECRLGSD